MDTANCISNKTWEAYAQKTLSPAEVGALQKHAETCELCADIKEGIEALGNPATLPQTVAQINEAVDEYLAPKRSKIGIWWYWSAAAVLLATLGLGWYVLPTNTSKIVENKPVQVVDTPKNTVAQMPLDSGKPGNFISETTTPKKKAKNAVSDVIAEGKNTHPRPIVTEDDRVYKAIEDVVEQNPKPANKDAGPENVTIHTTTEKEEPYTLDNLSVAPAAPTEQKKIAKRDIYPSGVLSNNATNSYMNNNVDMNTHIELYSDTRHQDSVNFAAATGLFNKKLYDSSIVVLQNITFNTASTYYEQAQLLTAQTLIKQNKPDEAKQLLTQVVFQNKRRKKEAKQLLKTLE